MTLDQVIYITSLCDICTWNKVNNPTHDCTAVCDDKLECSSFEVTTGDN